MQTSPSTQQRPRDYQLRVAIVYQGSIVFDTTLERPTPVGLGAGQMLELECEVVPPEHILLGWRESLETYVLRLAPGMRGEVRRGGVCAVVSSLTPSCGVRELPVSPGDWGVLQIGDADVVFQFVLSPRALRRRWAFAHVHGALTRGVQGMVSVTGVALVAATLKISSVR